MNKDKWEKTIGQIKDSFGVTAEYEEELEDVPNSNVQIVEFNGPLGKMRLEFTTKPAVLDKKTTYSKLAGSTDQIEYVYSETEMIESLKAYREEDDEWVEIDASSFE